MLWLITKSLSFVYSPKQFDIMAPTLNDSYRMPKLTTLTLHTHFTKHLCHKSQGAVCAICETGQRFLLLNDKSKFRTVLQSFPYF